MDMTKIAWKLPRLIRRVLSCFYFLTIPAAFFLVEWFAFGFLAADGLNYWPLAVGGLWAVLLGGIVRAIPGRLARRIVFGILYFVSLLYAAVQTGYYLLFKQMLWISDFRYASEGSDYFSVLLSYPALWWLLLAVLLALGVLLIWKSP